MRLKRKATLILVLALLAAVVACQDDLDPDQNTTGSANSENLSEMRLNVILITIDTLRADALGAYGQERFTSPTLDRLSKGGVLFNEAMTSAPNTLPSHASIMTAKTPNAHGARANAGYVLSDENETLAEILQQSGYVTGAEIAAPVINHTTLLNQGFDQYRDITSGDIERKTISIDSPEGPLAPFEIDERSATDITKFGIEFLKKNSQQPFFLWLHYFDPHSHYAAPSAYLNLIPDSPYHAEVRYVDSEVGRLLRHLPGLQLDERTIVVITSDHGESLGEHGEKTHSALVYQSTMHVPLIVWGPATSIRKDWRVDSPVRTIDIAPTILDMLNLPAMTNVQGRSLVPLMTGESSDLQLVSYGESIELHSMFGSSILRYLRKGDWKYIHKLRPELFNLAQDPGELRDLASQHPGKVKELASALYQEIRSAPQKATNAEVAIDDETILQLQALGYASAGPSKDLGDELASLELKGPDPSDLAEDYLAFSQGAYYLSVTDYEKAALIFRDLAKRHPKSLTILTALANPLIALERYDEAVVVLNRAVEVDPGYERAYSLLARSADALGHLEEAEAASRKALEIQPCVSESRLRLATILEKTDRPLEQARTLKAGIESCPDSYEVLNNYAYLLSTSPNPEIRNGTEAVRIAKLAVKVSAGTRPEILDTLAGAHAEAGDFKKAVSVSRRAIEMARERNMSTHIIAALKKNMDRFREGRPARED